MSINNSLRDNRRDNAAGSSGGSKDCSDGSYGSRPNSARSLKDINTVFSHSGLLFNAYPDSLGGALRHSVALLSRPELSGIFDSFYILPSLFHADLDRGFSIIDYGLNRELAAPEDLAKLREAGLTLKLDFILNHLSVASPQFRDLLARGDKSAYRDFFIDWNRFWAGEGELSADGYVLPKEEHLSKMFFRKAGLPILQVEFADGQSRPYWNTFYQEIKYTPLPPDTAIADLTAAASRELVARINRQLPALKATKALDLGPFEPYREAVTRALSGHRTYLGQMDLNAASPQVWAFYAQTLRQLAAYGSKIIRLDAFAYLAKKPGARNFLNVPETWEILERIKRMAAEHGLILLPEIHAAYAEKIHQALCARGHLAYDFYLPGLLLHAFIKQNIRYLKAWCEEIRDSGLHLVNMLGCHDGIPLLDLKGLIPDAEIDEVIAELKARGGLVKDLHGAENLYYQVNATYFSALGEDENKLLLARAIQLFMPEAAQIWYLDLFAGRNDYAALQQPGASHKDINRTNLSLEQVEAALSRPVVRKQLELLRLRAEHPAFGAGSVFSLRELSPSALLLRRDKGTAWAELRFDLNDFSWSVKRSGI